MHSSDVERRIDDVYHRGWNDIFDKADRMYFDIEMHVQSLLYNCVFDSLCVGLVQGLCADIV